MYMTAISQLHSLALSFHGEFGGIHSPCCTRFDLIGESIGDDGIYTDRQNPLLIRAYRELVTGVISESEYLNRVSEIGEVAFGHIIPESERAGLIQEIAKLIADIKPSAARYFKRKDDLVNYLAESIFGDSGLTEDLEFCHQVDQYLAGDIGPDELVSNWRCKHCPK